MSFAVLLTITLVSLFGSISSSPSPSSPSQSAVQEVGELDRIRRADPQQLVQLVAGLRRSSDDRLEMKATDLLRSVIRIVQSYTDDDFEDLLKVIQDKVEKIDNPDQRVVELKTTILKKLKDMRAGGAGGAEAAKGAKGDLGEVLTRLQDSKYEARAFRLDSADKRASALNILTTLNDLDTYRLKAKRADISLSEVVRGGFEALAALLAAQGPRSRADPAAPSPSTERAPEPTPAAAQPEPAPALGELVLLSLLGLPALTKMRLQLVKETPPTD